MFHSARLKLTLWYLAIIMAVSLTFSLVIYRFLSLEIERFEKAQRYRIERIGPFRRFAIPIDTNPELIEEAKQRILFALIGVNGSVFILSGALGYLLASRTLKPIQNMYDEQNRFISDASHELKTPLTSLKSAFEVFLRSKKKTLAEAEELIRESVTDVDNLHSLSESLLELAQYETPNNTKQFERLSLKQIILKAIHKVEPLAQEKNLILKTDLMDIEVEGNKYSLIDLFISILDNAIKYSNNHKSIAIKVSKTDSKAQ